jgi:CRISPR-associated protein Cas4
MESYLTISFLNDFIFCPRSIYFHQLYGRVNQRLYQTAAQTKGKAAHKTIDNQHYSTAKAVLQGTSIYSSRYNLGGKIDTFDTDKGLLVERKKKIKVIYDGYIYQLYAQYHCLTEMGYNVRKIRFHSLDDNKNYPIKLPHEAPELQRAFEDTLQQIRSYNLEDDFTANPNKCKYCIYHNLCDKAAG